jgi:hypothetical protein
LRALADLLRERWRTVLLDGGILASLMIAGWVLRAHELPQAQVTGDIVAPYFQALLLLWPDASPDGAFPLGLDGIWPTLTPWAPQFGPAFAWTGLLFVTGASSLEGVLARRMFLQATLAILLYVALRWPLGRRLPSAAGRAWQRDWPARAGAIVAALAVGFLGDPFGTLGRAEQGYLMPDVGAWITVAVAMVVLGGRRRWLLVAIGLLPVALMLHPFGLAFVPGIALLVAWIWREGHRRLVLTSLGIGVVLSIPEGIHVLNVLSDEQVGAALFTEAVTSTAAATHETVLHTAIRAFRELEPSPAGPLLALAPVVVVFWGIWRRSTGAVVLACWSLATVLSLFVVGHLIGYLQINHWRVVLPVLALQAGLATSLSVAGLLDLAGRGGRWPRSIALAAVAVCLVGLLAGCVLRERRVYFDGSSDLSLHRLVSHDIHRDAGDRDRWFDALVVQRSNATWDGSSVAIRSLFLEHRLTIPDSIAVKDDGLLYLTVDGTPETVVALRDAMSWRHAPVDASLSPDDAPPAHPRPAPSFPGVTLVREYRVEDSGTVLLVRLDDPAASHRWSRWLCEHAGAGGAHLLEVAPIYLAETSTPEQKITQRDWFPGCLTGEEGAP